jgi:hypothetical protein
MKKPTREEHFERCGRKRRYRTEADALQAAGLLGLESERTAYACDLCGRWHLASVNPGRGRAPTVKKRI